MAPTDAPTTKSGSIPKDSSVRSMPTWIAPRLPPPVKTNAVFGLPRDTIDPFPAALDAFQTRRFPAIGFYLRGTTRLAVFRRRAVGDVSAALRRMAGAGGGVGRLRGWC